MNGLTESDDAALRVLVVEDDDLVGDTILAMLDETCSARLVTETRSALQVLDGEADLDVILLDLLLPGGGVPALLARADAKRVPVILTSGSVTEIARLGQGRPVLPKPFTAEDLLTLLLTTARKPS